MNRGRVVFAIHGKEFAAACELSFVQKILICVEWIDESCDSCEYRSFDCISARFGSTF